MTPQDRLRIIIDMAGRGLKDDAIACELNVQRHYISATRLALGINCGAKSRERRIVCDLSDKTQSFKSIAKKHGITIYGVYRMAKRNNIQPRDKPHGVS